MDTYGLMDWNPQVLCWNVRGLNNMSKRNSARNFISEAKVNLVCLQETKLDVIDVFVVMQCIGPSFDGFAYLSAEETRGGVLLAWDSSVLEVESIQLDTNFITGRVRTKVGEPWWISVLYGP